MYSNQVLLDAVQRERNPSLGELEREHEAQLEQMERGYRPPETPHEYVMRMIHARRWL